MSSIEPSPFSGNIYEKLLKNNQKKKIPRTNQLGKALRYCGHATDYDDVIIQGDLKGMKFVAYYVKGERVLAVASVASDPVVSKASELMRVDAMPSASQLRSGNISLLDITTPAADAVSPSL